MNPYVTKIVLNPLFLIIMWRNQTKNWPISTIFTLVFTGTASQLSNFFKFFLILRRIPPSYIESNILAKNPIFFHKVFYIHPAFPQLLCFCCPLVFICLSSWFCWYAVLTFERTLTQFLKQDPTSVEPHSLEMELETLGYWQYFCPIYL